jgi:hypothetical protein
MMGNTSAMLTLRPPKATVFAISGTELSPFIVPVVLTFATGHFGIQSPCWCASRISEFAMSPACFGNNIVCSGASAR